MAKMVIQHDVDPGIAIVLRQGGETEVQGWHGTCTECGWPVHRWLMEAAVLSAQAHVKKHESGL